MPGALVERHEEAHGGVDRHVDGVFPRHRMDRLQRVVERQEEEPVQVERVRELAVVLHRPDLRLAERRQIRLRLPERHAVDVELRLAVGTAGGSVSRTSTFVAPARPARRCRDARAGSDAARRPAARRSGRSSAAPRRFDTPRCRSRGCRACRAARATRRACRSGVTMTSARSPGVMRSSSSSGDSCSPPSVPIT